MSGAAELTPSPAPPTAGLSEAEAQRRLQARGPIRREAGSRSYASIVRSNVFTVFNAILAGFGIVTLVFADWRDALFLGILVANTAIGITQEVRAKRALDRLALLVAPRATVVRDGAARQVAPEEVVEGDLVRLQAGDQIVVDGEVVAATDLRLDESILTGESEPITRGAGDTVHSGAFVVEGSGEIVVTAVGDDSYAQRLLGEARAFRHPRSPLEVAVNRLLLALVGLVVVLGAILGYALWHRQADRSEAVETAAAGVVSLVPEGLVVLVSLTYAVASLKMARRGVLAQQLNAIESLASANVVCVDKTGTLTEAALRVVATVPAAGVEPAGLEGALRRYAAASSVRNATLTAIAEALPAEGPATPDEEVPFASRRRWSAVRLGDETLVLGAPERFDLGPLEADAARERDRGRRVVAIASTPAPAQEGPDGAPPPGCRVLGLVVLAERLRPQTRDTVEFLLSQNVEIKVLSGDNPQTVAAIAADAGIPVGEVLTGADLPQDPGLLRETVQRVGVVGRVAPEDKRRFVEALRESGRYVAMIGDGVNDVPALKASRLAIAQGTGAQMARGVSDLVLVNGDFAAVPALVAEGRQTLRNLQRVARLYVTKSSFAAFLILVIGITSTAYPLLPRHFSLAAALTIGIPTFFLALAPSTGPWRPDGFGRNVAAFALPAGVLTGVGVVASYLFALYDLDLDVTEARTTATTVLVAVGLYLVVELERSSRGARGRLLVSGMCALLGLGYVLTLVLPFARDFFDLALPSVAIGLTAAGGAAISIAAIWLARLPATATGDGDGPAG
ncbi:MAG: HAD-IC family P-type ATPase [Solirubrobacteraceae bacterium]|nr:HAD-IC family P-type ATPase [Solirubrobacteraceae bacterium]